MGSLPWEIVLCEFSSVGLIFTNTSPTWPAVMQVPPMNIIWPWFKNFSLGKNLHFPLWFPIYRQIQSAGICQACMAIHFSIIPNSWCTFRLSMSNLSWADLFRLFDQAVSKRTGIEEVGIPGIHLGGTGIMSFEEVCDCSFQNHSPFPSTGAQ